MSILPTVDSTSDARHPFGLPLGSVRGFMSLAICGFFWVVLLFPGDPEAIRPPLGHFFLLGLVMMAFASTPHVALDESAGNVLPWTLRLIFVGGSVAVLAYVAAQFPERLRMRLTPEETEFKTWWLTLLACTAGGFAVGLVVRLLFRRTSPLFRTIRSWLSVVGLTMLALEIGFVLINATSQAPKDFLQYWDAAELCVVAAYFGTRA